VSRFAGRGFRLMCSRSTDLTFSIFGMKCIYIDFPVGVRCNPLLREPSQCCVERPQRVPALMTISFLPLQTHESEAGAGTQNQQNSNAACVRAEQQQPVSASYSDFHTCGYSHAEQVTGTARPPGEGREKEFLRTWTWDSSAKRRCVWKSNELLFHL